MILRIRGLSCLPAAAAVAALAAGALPVSAQTHAAAHAHTKAHATQGLKEKASYSIGVLMGAQLRQLGLTTDSVAFDQVAKGLHDVVKGTVEPSNTDRQNVQAYILATRMAMGAKNQAAARQFLAVNAKRKGVMTTASGLQYRVLRAGSGATPRPTDEVTVNYRGTLLDGTEFDSSYKRGMPATFPVNHVIKGWQEALVLMKPGSKWELYVPPELAYGENSPPPIPPGSLLKFQVELLSVKPASASPSGAGPNVGGGAH